jgi:hypothetical protein
MASAVIQAVAGPPQAALSPRQRNGAARPDVSARWRK